MFSRKNLPARREQAGRNDQREPSPLGVLATIILFQPSHGLGSHHLGIACIKSDILGETIGGLQVDAVAQRAVEAGKIGGHGEIVVGQFAVELAGRRTEHTREGFLQTGGKVTDIGTLIEEVHDAVERVARAI